MDRTRARVSKYLSDPLGSLWLVCQWLVEGVWDAFQILVYIVGAAFVVIFIIIMKLLDLLFT